LRGRTAGGDGLFPRVRPPALRAAMGGPTGMGRMHRCALALGVTSQLGRALAAYTCESGEAVGEVFGETGNLCTPRCGPASECPSSVPAGVTAQPQCMLQDVNQVAYCGLLCQVDSQCPSGSACRKVAAPNAPEVSLCVHSLSYSEWTSGQAQRIKLTVGFPTQPGQSAKGFQLAKAYAALQSMKRRFSIPDTDGDVLVVKELLAAASTLGGQGAPSLAQSGGAPASGGGSRGPLGAWRHDVSYFANNVESGIPGLQREIHDTVWNLEHLERYGVCSELLRGIILMGAGYLVFGCVYKNQALGATGIDMVPHLGFWMQYPDLVRDGAKYAQILAADAFGGRSDPFAGDGGFAGPGRRDPDRDTFANFEPIR